MKFTLNNEKPIYIPGDMKRNETYPTANGCNGGQVCLRTYGFKPLLSKSLISV